MAVGIMALLESAPQVGNWNTARQRAAGWRQRMQLAGWALRDPAACTLALARILRLPAGTDLRRDAVHALFSATPRCHIPPPGTPAALALGARPVARARGVPVPHLARGCRNWDAAWREARMRAWHSVDEIDTTAGRRIIQQKFDGRGQPHVRYVVPVPP
jgi:hypothetical protein